MKGKTNIEKESIKALQKRLHLNTKSNAKPKLQKYDASEVSVQNQLTGDRFQGGSPATFPSAPISSNRNDNGK